MQIIYKSEKQKIINQLKEQYGIMEIPFLLIRFGREKIRAYSGNLSTEEIYELENKLKIPLMGLYFLTESPDGLRLSLDAIHILKEQIIKNILELNKEQTEQWFRGEDIEITEEWKEQEKTFKILKYGEDFVGCGKLSFDRIVNYLPKERRIKSGQSNQ